jgi:ferredoxin
VSFAPKVFQLQPDDATIVLIPTPPKEMQGAAVDAAAGCPRAAIVIESD